ncbi:DUF1700 domain-containing protein [Dysosmobacter sp.]|uniref:DUF1700 domain-containing protein n=1 Tax=Dysosmobacter sp. TaxID=2591382 RepID=UPI003AEF9704
MNNKESFLRALQSGLTVLAESEQQDILEEYSQHIDMKMAGGLTEEEAIQDFGDIRQLTAEILAAYHVDPSYTAHKGIFLHLSNLPSLLSKAGSRCRAAAHRLGNAFIRLGRKIAGIPHHMSGWLHLHFGVKSSQTQPAEEREAHTMDTLKQESAPTRGKASVLKHFFWKAGRGIASLCRLAAWLIWNGALLLCAVPFAATGLFALFCLGLLVVWMAQGLPLAGAALGCIGILLFCVGVLGLGSALIWHRVKQSVPTPEKLCDTNLDIAVQQEPVEEEVMQDDAE